MAASLERAIWERPRVSIFRSSPTRCEAARQKCALTHQKVDPFGESERSPPKPKNCKLPTRSQLQSSVEQRVQIPQKARLAKKPEPQEMLTVWNCSSVRAPAREF